MYELIVRRFVIMML